MIGRFKQQILSAVPGTTITIDWTEIASGSTFVNFFLSPHTVEVEFHPVFGIGISVRGGVHGAGGYYGDGPEEAFEFEADAINRVINLLKG